jgi:hypothetical protein
MSRILFLTVVSFFFVLAGCTSNKVSCLHDHKIITAKTDTESVRIPYVDVKHEGNSLIVSGVLKRNNMPSHHNVTSHVDVFVVDGQGSLLAQARTSEIYVPQKRIGKGTEFARFRVVLPMEVQQNITVRAEPHNDQSCSLEES